VTTILGCLATIEILTNRFELCLGCQKLIGDYDPTKGDCDVSFFSGVVPAVDVEIFA
jgi:hypothetical protein